LNMNVKFLLRIIIVNIAIVQTIQCPSSYSASLLTSAFYGNGEMPGCIEFVQ